MPLAISRRSRHIVIRLIRYGADSSVSPGICGKGGKIGTEMMGEDLG